MDIGVYRHRRVRLWCGIVIPLAMLSLAYAALLGRQRCLSAAIKDYRSMAALMPRVQASFDRTAARLAALSPVASESGAAAASLRREVNAAAQAAGLGLSSVVIEERVDTTGGLALRLATLQGSGTLPAIARTIATLQTPGRPVLTESLVLGVTRMEGEPVYELQAAIRVGGRRAETQDDGGEYDHVEN